MNYHYLNNLMIEVPLLNNKYYKQLYLYESKLGDTLKTYSEQHNLPYLNINLVLGEKLQYVEVNRRPYRAVELVNDIISNLKTDTLCIDYYELLFEPSLKLNPFELFKSISRNKTLLIAWRGSYKDGYFIHATPGHPEYIKEKITDTVLIH